MAVRIQFNGLVKRFDGVTAVDGVSLAIEPGELFFLLGPSGCGKTTLLRCLAGFCAPDAGSVCIDGDDMTRRPPHERDTGMVFQSYALWPHMTVRENVAFGLEQRRLPREEIARRVREALDTVRMGDRADARPQQLSGGQQQRVAVARALAVRPRCLLLDEPLSNLDARLRVEMRTEIRRICKDAGLTAVYVTHDQKEALSIADRIAVLRDGRVEQVGTPPAIYRRPANRFTAHFIGETNFIDGTVEAAGRDGATVRTPWGVFRAGAAPDGLAPGAAVTLSIRPEAWRFDPPPDAANAIAGELHDTLYLGETAQHQVRVAPAGSADELALAVLDLRPRFVARDPVRAPVRLWADPDDVVVLTS